MPALNDVIGVVSDPVGGTISFYLNGVLKNTTTPIGTAVEVYAGAGLYSTGDQWTFNFGASAFAYSVPSGALPWDLEETSLHKIYTPKQSPRPLHHIGL